MVAVDVFAGSSLYAAARSAGPRPDGVANGLILFCVSVRTRALQANRPPLHTALWGCCSMVPSSSAWRSPLSSRSAVAQLVSTSAPAAMASVVMDLMAFMMAADLFTGSAILDCATCATASAGRFARVGRLSPWRVATDQCKRCIRDHVDRPFTFHLGKLVCDWNAPLMQISAA